MKNDMLVPIGTISLVGIHAVLLALGFSVPPTDLGAFTSPAGATYASAALGSLALIGGGAGCSPGPFTWRGLTALGYVLLSVPLVTSAAYVDPAQGYVIQAGWLAAVGCSVALLLSMAADVAFDSRHIVTFESSRGQ